MIAARGFSLVDLLVALLCTSLLAGATSTLLVGSAGTARQAWAVERARGVAAAAMARVAADLETAGFGLERADALLDGGNRVAVVGTHGSEGLRLLLALGDALEIAAHITPGRYELAESGTLAVGDKVVGIDPAGRPEGSPLPAGTVIGVFPSGSHTAVEVAWPPVEAAALAAWGAPRALLPVRWRDYEARAWRGAVQLRRRHEGGPWQPVVDNLAGFRIEFAVDTDGDGVADRRDSVFQGNGRLCGVRLEAEAVVAAHRASVSELAGDDRESSIRWIGLPWC